MAEERQYVLESLREGAGFNLYRGTELGNQAPLLAVAVATEHPSPQSLRRLEHEYALASELDAAWAARPLALTRHQGRAVLLLKDPGGEPLDRLIDRGKGQPIDLTRFLIIAIGLAAALGRVHRQGLIHMDVKPANVLVDDAGQVWLTGFGIASRHPRERLSPAPPETVAGTLAYMSPEQTGRMNRSVDARSDLYSLGVTLYEILTGVLPFAAADPLEWIHCHIARQPAPPTDRRAVPQQLSAIVIRLLAKNAEERYQTAEGLEADLRRCLSEWQSQARIDPFPLGADDASDRLLIPETLYGREREVDALLTAFDRVLTQGATELVLVSGYSGVGKSSVVNELQKVLVPPRGLFAAGKFHRYKRDVPYATLAQAFQSLIRQLLCKSEAELHTWRETLGEALGPNGRLIVDLVPQLELIIGQQPPVADLPPQDAQRRFQTVLRRFIGAFARSEHPLALFLDDLQWADPATLDLLEDLLLRGDVRHLLLIGAYRDNEVDPTHPFVRKLYAMRRAGAIVHDILLTPLSGGDLGQLIGDALHCEQERARPLTELVLEKTGGNPFFAIQFLQALAEEELLVFDHAESRWCWDLRRIHAKRYSDNVVDLMIAKLCALPAETSAALRQLGCVGSGAKSALLATICQTSTEKLPESLWEAVRAGLVVRSEDTYAFLHDRIQEAAYSLIPEVARAEIHLQIGRLLLANTPPDGRDDSIFEIVSQFNRSKALITSTEEREQVAQLNLIAGKRAKNAAAYVSALSYFADGQALLAEDCWTRRYPLAFELEFHRAECDFLTGDLAGADQRLSALSSVAANLVDQAAVTCLRVDLYQVLCQPDRAVAVCLGYLEQVGVEWPPHPTDEDVRREYERIWPRIGSRPIEDLIDLPLMIDVGTRATMDVLTKVMPSTQCTDDKLLCLVITRMVNLSLEHGNCNASCCGYVWFGLVLVSRFGDYPASRRFGQLSLDLVGRRGLDAFKARVYEAFSIFVSPWAQHFRNGHALLQQAFSEANRIGDLTYASYCCNNLVTSSLASGKNLRDIEQEARDGIDFALKAQFGMVVDIVQGQLCLIRVLRGLTRNFNSFDETGFEESRFEERLAADPNLAVAACWYWIRKLQARVFARDYASALEAAAKAQALLWTSPAFFEQAEYHFYDALARAGAIDTAGDVRTDVWIAHMRALAAHYRQHELWAEHCPENFESRTALVGAELARLEGRDGDAQLLYEQAINSARANGFVHIEATANELAGGFYLARGIDTAGYAYLRNALSGYDRWGARGKVKQLIERFPRLHEERTPAALAMMGAAGQLDVETVVKASQALSSEMVLPKLIERLMRIVVEHAGAERALLILFRDGEPRNMAEATTGPGKIEVAARHAAITRSDLPQSMLHYAIRTHDRVLLDDASTDSVYSRDEYVRLKRSRSALCLPIVKQAKLIGALYLENNLTSGAFTRDRVTVLELLASQAAISLENADLYTDLQLQVEILQQLPVSAWTLKPDGTPDFVNQVWLDFAGQTPDFVRSHPAAWMTALHPDDREMAAKSFWDGVHSGEGFAFETRSLRARDGTYRWHLNQAVVLRDFQGKVVKFVGTTTDIDDQKRTEEALRQLQSDLARINRVTTMGELAASLAHELSQPLSGATTNANTCVRKLAENNPNLDELRAVVSRFARDARRAADIIGRIRSQFARGAPNREVIDVNELSLETIALMRDEAVRHNISVRTELAADLPQIVGDRVQLQQVAMNLIANGIEAMKGVDGIREMVIKTQRADSEQILVSFSDTGIGFPPQLAEQIFEPFFTTKPHGTGMGLRISRSIIESHGGRLWADGSPGRGAAFHVSLTATGKFP